MNVIDRIELFKKLHAIFKKVLGNKTPDRVFETRHMNISDDGKRLYSKSCDYELSEIMYDADFPRVHHEIELYHFTKFENFQKIIQSQKIHLHPVSKRMSQGEFLTYAEEHGLDGYYLNDPETGTPYGEELCKDLYYLSLTDLGQDDTEEYLEEEFGKIRLKLKVAPVKQRCDLRKMAYQKSGKTTAYKSINDALNDELGMTFVPHRISRIPAFYLPLGMDIESEYRLVIKKHIGGCDNTIQSGQWKVWPAALSSPDKKLSDLWCKIELLEIKMSKPAMQGRVKSEIVNTIYESVPVV